MWRRGDCVDFEGTCPAKVLARIAARRSESSKKVDRGLEGAPQPRVLDPVGVTAQRITTVRIARCEDRLADLLGRPTEEARRAASRRCRGVEFVRRRQRRQAVLGPTRDGKAKQQQ